MQDDKLNMETRLIAYNEDYGFIENPKDFNFEYNPHRLIVKNYALRTGDKATYNKYLDNFFPDLSEIELKNFDVEIKYIKAFNNEELARWLASNDVKVVQSDISADDPEAIFKMVDVSDSENPDMYVIEEEDFILNRILPRNLIKTENKTWINIKLPIR